MLGVAISSFVTFLFNFNQPINNLDYIERVKVILEY